MDSKSILPKPDDISSSCIGKKGNSSRLLIVIIVPVVGTVIIFGFLYSCWLNRKMRKIRTGISFTLGELINDLLYLLAVHLGNLNLLFYLYMMTVGCYGKKNY